MRNAASYPFSISRDPGGVDVRDKLELVRNFEAKVRSMEPRIIQVRIMYRDTRQNVTISTTDEGSKLDSRMQVVFTVLLVGRDGSEMQTSYEAAGGFYGFEYFSEEVMGSLAEKTVRRLSGPPCGTRSAKRHEDGRSCIRSRRHHDPRGDRPWARSRSGHGRAVLL